MSSLTVRLSDELKQQLDELSALKHVAVSDLVRESIRRYVLTEQFAALRAQIIPMAEAQGFLTDDDVFKATS